MANYRNIHGINIETVTSNPDNPANGQVWYNSTDQKLRGNAQSTVGAWASGGNMNTARKDTVAGAGVQTAAIVFGGSTPPVSALAETYNGSSFTEVADLGTARNALGGAGTSTSALGFGGEPPRAETESWNGSSWTEVGDLNTARWGHAGAGKLYTAA